MRRKNKTKFYKKRLKNSNKFKIKLRKIKIIKKKLYNKFNRKMRNYYKKLKN